MKFKPRITVCDALESGACYDGVVAYVESHGNEIACDSMSDDGSYVVAISCRDGDGSGSGYGYGSGSGYGDGSGDGDGSGYGDGDGVV